MVILHQKGLRLITLLFYFFITLGVSTLFAMGGIGGAIALVSIFPMTGLSLNDSKALSLFVNTSSMISSSYMNFKRGVLHFKFAMPLVISVIVSSFSVASSSASLSLAFLALFL